MEVEGQDMAAPTKNAVVKVVTCDMFEFTMHTTKMMDSTSTGELAPDQTRYDRGDGGCTNSIRSHSRMTVDLRTIRGVP